MLTCKEASRLISESLERRLDFGERWRLRIHLWVCVNCRRFDRQLILLQQAVRMLRIHAEHTNNAEDLPPDARERIRKALVEYLDRPH